MLTDAPTHKKNRQFFIESDQLRCIDLPPDGFLFSWWCEKLGVQRGLLGPPILRGIPTAWLESSMSKYERREHLPFRTAT